MTLPVDLSNGRTDSDSCRFILSDTSDATASVTVSGSSRCMSPNVDEHVHVLVSDSISSSVRLHPAGGKPVSMCIEELEEGLDLLEMRAPRDGVSVQIRVDKPPVFEFREMIVME